MRALASLSDKPPLRVLGAPPCGKPAVWAYVVLSCVLVAFILILAVSCGNEKLVQSSRLVFGTSCSIAAPAGADVESVWKRLAELDGCLSAHVPDSELSRLNERAGQGWVSVSDDLHRAIGLALEMAEASGGAFNPAVGNLVELWDIGGENPKVPEQEQIDRALEHSDWRKVELGPDNSVRIVDSGLKLDLGAIGKGFAADEAARMLAGQGVDSALLNFGGNIMAVGRRPDGKMFRIGIQAPFEQRNSYNQVVRIAGESVVTSGVYERFFTGEDGTLYHHILNPDTGYPALSGLLSVTIIGSESAVCDGLSTACFVLGVERGLALLEGFPGYRAIFLMEDGSAVPYGISI